MPGRSPLSLTQAPKLPALQKTHGPLNPLSAFTNPARTLPANKISTIENLILRHVHIGCKIAIASSAEKGKISIEEMFDPGGSVAGLAEIAASMLVSAQRRLDVISGNVSNINSAGFRSRRVYQQVLDAREGMPTVFGASPQGASASALRSTGNALDIAITGGGAMLVRSGNRLVPVISAQLHRDREGRLVDGAGRALQAAGGGDIVLSDDQATLLKDGTMIVGGQPVARVGSFAVDPSIDPVRGIDAEITVMPDVAEESVLHQGVIVPSNVDLGTEMVEMTRASRMAETGARVFQLHDDLIGRVASKMSEAVR